jgi:hypothetical protein
VLGCVFLRCIYAIYDQGNTRFGCIQRDLPPPSSGGQQAFPLKVQQVEPAPPTDEQLKKKKRRRLGLLGCCRSVN